MTPDQLARIHRVREVQVRLAEADEARARDKESSERRLGERIGQLVAAVSPAPGAAGAAALGAAAHFRERLQQSSAAADARLQAASLQSARAGEVVVGARRDRLAAEKLRDRAQAHAAEAARRLPELTPSPRRNRHDPC